MFGQGRQEPAKANESGHRPQARDEPKRSRPAAFGASGGGARAMRRNDKISRASLAAGGKGQKGRRPKPVQTCWRQGPRPGAGQRARSSKEGSAREKVLPNPSLKGSTNGVPPGPEPRYGVHCLSSGPGVPPSVLTLAQTLGCTLRRCGEPASQFKDSVWKPSVLFKSWPP
jgi:hypothetical protein